MSLPKFEEIKELTEQELSEQIVAVKKELFQLRFQKATRQLDKPHQFKHLRHRLAQLMTLEQQRKLAAATSEATPDTASATEEEE
jgi:large subunit ribosomal protein L29